MSHLMPLECWVMERCSTITGSQAHGFRNRSPNQSSTKNYSLLWLQYTFRVHSGCPRGSSSYCGRDPAVRQFEGPTIMSLLCYLCPLAACHSFCSTASPVSGKCNPIANSLSRFQFQRSRNWLPIQTTIRHESQGSCIWT